MSFLPSLFLSNIKAKDGLAKPCRFQVILPIPEYVGNFISTNFIETLLNLPNTIFSDLTTKVLGDENDGKKYAKSDISRYLGLQCEAAELPGKQLQTQEARIYGPSYKVPFRAAYTDIGLTFLCTNEFYERKLFDRWLESIIPTDTNNVRFPKGDGNLGKGYMTDIKIVQYDDFVKQIYAVQLIDAFPVAINSQPLSWSEDGFHRLTVQFAYQRYRTIYDGGYDLAAAATAVLGSSIGGISINKLLDPQSKGLTETLNRIF